MRRVLALVALTWAATAAPAGAATVTVTRASFISDRAACLGCEVSLAARFVADTGETNALTVEGIGSHRVRFVDPGATIRQPGPHCTVESAHVAVCDLNRPADDRVVVADLKDGDDSYAPRALPTRSAVLGGPGADHLDSGLPSAGLDDDYDNFLYGQGGADELVGHRGEDSLDGGRGNDELTGGGNDDELSGGRGDDVLAAGPGHDFVSDGGGRDTVAGGPAYDAIISDDQGVPAPDRFDGGPGRDNISYEGRSTGVTVRLDRGVGGARTERDRVTSFRDVDGTSHADLIVGTDRANAIFTGDGADVVRARGGPDRISGYGNGADIGCGAGFDRGPSYGFLRPDCERTNGVVRAPAQPRRVTASAVALRLPCGFEGADPARRVVKLITSRFPRRWWPDAPFGQLIATGTVPPGRPDRLCRVILTLTPAGRARRASLPVLIAGLGVFNGPLWTFELPTRPRPAGRRAGVPRRSPPA